jgi:plasmid stabilization system protein ParE
MPHVIITERAQAGINRCFAFLYAIAPKPALRARRTILETIKRLRRFPYHGRPYIPPFPNEAEEGEGLRELIIKGGYLALYRYIEEENTVYIMAVKHGREAKYY